MTITLSLDIESAIAERARERGTTLEQLALDSLRRTFVSPKLTPDEILGLAANVYAGLSEQDVYEVEKITLDRDNHAGDWNQPGMDAYDDYDAAKHRLGLKGGC